MTTLTITTIQANIKWEDKEANLAMFEERINNIKEKTEVVVLPEMFSTGFSMRPGDLSEKMNGCTMDWMKKIAAEKKIILTGSIIIEEQGNYYNRLIWLQPDGRYGSYDKRHLFGYAGEHDHYNPGNKRLITSVNGWKINLQVCYDLRFPVWARQSYSTGQPGSLKQEENILPEFDLLIYVANWPEKRNHAWKILLQARAIENQCFVVGVNRVGTDGEGHYYSGDSMIIDPMGELLYTKAHEEDANTIVLDKKNLDEIRNKLPFLKDRDGFHIEI
jgi:predicted amidohydrolase